MYILFSFSGSTVVTLGDPPPTSSTISDWIQFFKVTLIFVCCLFIFLTLPSQKRVCFSKLFNLVSKGLVDLRQLADCCHHLVHVALVRGCSHFQVIQCGGNVMGWDHIFIAVISHISCTQLLGEIEVIVLVHKKPLNEIHICLFARFFLHSLQVLTQIQYVNAACWAFWMTSASMYGVFTSSEKFMQS